MSNGFNTMRSFYHFNFFANESFRHFFSKRFHSQAIINKGISFCNHRHFLCCWFESMSIGSGRHNTFNIYIFPPIFFAKSSNG